MPSQCRLSFRHMSERWENIRENQLSRFPFAPTDPRGAARIHSELACVPAPRGTCWRSGRTTRKCDRAKHGDDESGNSTVNCAPLIPAYTCAIVIRHSRTGVGAGSPHQRKLSPARCEWQTPPFHTFASDPAGSRERPGTRNTNGIERYVWRRIGIPTGICVGCDRLYNNAENMDKDNQVQTEVVSCMAEKGRGSTNSHDYIPQLLLLSLSRMVYVWVKPFLGGLCHSKTLQS